MRPPKFPLDRDCRYRIVRGVTMLFRQGSWYLIYHRHGKKIEESLSTRDDRLAYAELQKVSKALLDGVTPLELIGAKHHKTLTVAEAAKRFYASYTAIALGTRRKLYDVLSKWVIGERLDAATGEWVKRDDAAKCARPFSVREIHVVEKQDVVAHLKKVRATVNRLGRRNRRGTAKIVLDAVRLLFGWCLDEGLLRGKDGRVLANPASRCGKFTFDAEQDSKLDARAGHQRVKVFEPSQEQALVEWFHARCRRLYPLLLVGVDAGLRYGEAIALEIDDYDPDRHRLIISKHWSPYAEDGVIPGTKSSRLARGIVKTREVPTDLGDRLEPALDAHITWLRETRPRGWDGKRLFPAKPYRDDEGRENVGAYITPNNFYRVIWNKACADLGIKGLTFHNARHTFASKCLHAGATPQEVAAWLGDTLEVFYRHYAHVIEGLRRDRAGLLATTARQATGKRGQLRVIKR